MEGYFTLAFCLGCGPGEICGAANNFNYSDGCIYDEFIGRCYKCGCASTGRCIITWPITSKGKRLSATYTCDCNAGYTGKNCDQLLVSNESKNILDETWSTERCESEYGSTACIIGMGEKDVIGGLLGNGQIGECYCDPSCIGIGDCCFDSDC